MIIARVYLHSSCSPQPPNKKIKTQKAGIRDNWDQPYTEDPVLTLMVSVQSPGGEIHNLRLDSGGVSSKGLSFSLCRGLPMRSCLENLLASR